MASLKESLKAVRRKTAHGLWFIPERELRKVLTHDRVSQQLSECGTPLESLEETLNLALTTATKVFAILVRSSQEALMLECIENELLDDKLPLEAPMQGLELSAKFYQIQWEFLAPIFTRRSVALKLKDKHILPFLEDTKLDNAHGGYSNAFRVSLDPGHQGLIDVETSNHSVLLFRKELRSVEEEDFANRMFREEDRILKMLNTLKNESIIRVYISYRHKSTYNFLFPLADGDLLGLISSNSRPVLLENNTSVVKALHGLATAIAEVHNFNSKALGIKFKGCHHDIKPRNILVSEGKFLLADFGLSRLKPLEDDSTSTSKSIGEYLAPECRGVENERQLIGRKSDIWSFGCVIAEVLAYLDGGSEGVEQLRSNRKTITDQWTNYAFHSSGRIKTSVDQWLTRMSDSGRYGNYALIVGLVRQMLQPDPGSRPDSAVVRRVLCSLEAKFLLDDSLQLYRTLAAQYEDAYFVVECERLRAWGYTVGVFQPRGPWNWPTCQVDLLSEPALDALQYTLDKLQSIQLQSSTRTGATDEAVSFTGATVDDLSEGLPDDRMLHTYNDQLVALLSSPNKKMLNRFLFRSVLQTDNLDGLRRIESEVEAHGGPEQIGPLAQLKLIFQMAQQKELAKELKYKVPPDGKVVVTGTLEHHARGEYTTATSPSEDVLIEWRAINSPTQAVSEELLLRVDALAALSSVQSKPSEIRVLDCVGYYLDEARRAFGVLYRFPKVPSSRNGIAGEPISLFQLISSTATESALNARPFLGERFAMARSIASCILYCHSINWLHERLSSFNVIFFSSPGTSAGASQTLPFVVGFDHSRQDKENAFSHGPPSDERFQHYLHPKYFPSGRFQKRFDYYSVGLVLLEIGLWRTLSSITSKYKFHDREGVRKEIVERYLPGLLYSMGEIYYSVVHACLTDELGNEDSRDDEVATSFQELVVEKLERCVV